MQFELNKTFNCHLNGGLAGIESESFYKQMRDGRICSLIMELYISQNFDNMKLSLDTSYDILFNDIKIEVKCFTKGGLCILPSNQIGVGRSYDKDKFLSYITNKIYAICDIRSFPNVNIIFLSGERLFEISENKKGKLNVKTTEALFG